MIFTIQDISSLAVVISLFRTTIPLAATLQIDALSY